MIKIDIVEALLPEFGTIDTMIPVIAGSILPASRSKLVTIKSF